MNEIAPIKWRDAPEEHDYPAAQSYLALLYEDPIAGTTCKNSGLRP